MSRLHRNPVESDDKVDDLNMTPMIDVVFQLLIFFMLSMHFKAVEGKLLSQLPKDRGPNPALTTWDPAETRIVLCAGGDIETHLNDKGRHEKATKPNNEVVVLVERIEIGRVYRTDQASDRASANRAVYRALGAKARQLHDAMPLRGDPPRPAPVILDADSEVSYEHVIGALNACREFGIDNLQFAANPRFDKYYGSYEKGQFERDRR